MGIIPDVCQPLACSLSAVVLLRCPGRWPSVCVAAGVAGLAVKRQRLTSHVWRRCFRPCVFIQHVWGIRRMRARSPPLRPFGRGGTLLAVYRQQAVCILSETTDHEPNIPRYGGQYRAAPCGKRAYMSRAQHITLCETSMFQVVSLAKNHQARPFDIPAAGGRNRCGFRFRTQPKSRRSHDRIRTPHTRRPR